MLRPCVFKFFMRVARVCRVRGALSAPPTFEAASSSLNQFFDRLKADPPQAPARPTAEEEPAKEPDEARKVDAIAMLMAGRNAIAGRNNGTKSKPKVEPGAEPMPAQVPATILTSHSVPLNEMSPGQLGLEAIQAAIKAAPVAQWVASDLNTWGAFVMQQGAATSEFEAMEVAALGILDAFGMAKECAAPGVDDHSWMTKLQVEVPKGLQAVIAAARGGFLPPGTAVDAVAVQFGMAKLSNAPPVVALDAMEAAYRQELASKLPGIGGRQAPLPAAGPFEDGIKRKWEEEVPNGAPDDASGTGHAQKRVLQSERAGMAAAVHQQEHVNRAAEARQQAILEALGSYCEDDDDDDFA